MRGVKKKHGLSLDSDGQNRGIYQAVVECGDEGKMYKELRDFFDALIYLL